MFLLASSAEVKPSATSGTRNVPGKGSQARTFSTSFYIYFDGYFEPRMV